MKTWLPAGAIFFTLSACANTPAQPAFDAGTLAGTTWVQGAKGANQPLIRFTSGDSVNGTGGCNSFSGRAELSGSKVLLGPLASTKKMCIGPSQAVEDAFFRALTDTRSARKDGGQLVLLGEKGDELARLDPGTVRP